MEKLKRFWIRILYFLNFISKDQYLEKNRKVTKQVIEEKKVFFDGFLKKIKGEAIDNPLLKTEAQVQSGGGEIRKEMSYFSHENNLVQAFQYEEPPIGFSEEDEKKGMRAVTAWDEEVLPEDDIETLSSNGIDRRQEIERLKAKVYDNTVNYIEALSRIEKNK